ncbi:hypothetical protein AAMO2058_001122800 [Amorphochlora amoebiformis]
MEGKSIRVTVRAKKDAANVKMVLVTQSMSLNDLVEKANNSLKLPMGHKLYFQNGSVLDDLRLLRDNDTLVADTGGEDMGMDSYQVAIMGPGGVGKSAVTIRFCQNDWVEDYDPTIEDAYRHHFTVDSRPVTLDIMDTAGQEEYEALRQTWMIESKAFILVFDLTNPASLLEVEEKFSSKLAEIHEGLLPPLILVGNKLDLKRERKVSYNQAVESASKMGAVAYVEASAKSGQGVKAVFDRVVKELRARAKQVKANGAAQKTKPRKSFFCTMI